MRGSRAQRRGVAAVVLSSLASIAILAAPARAGAAVTPITDCMSPTSPGVFSVYYGYVNPGGEVLIEFGDENMVAPGLGYQGQPEVFNNGSYPRVFRAIFNSNAFGSIAWFLDGGQADATLATPRCEAGATGPVSDLTSSAATLNGLVDAKGVDTTYRFEYGTTIAYGSQTPERQLEATAGELVSEPITGLAPDTTYHYRLVAEGEVATAGEDRSFTTPAAAEPAKLVDLSVVASGPARARVGRKVTVTLRATNLGPAAATASTLIARASRGLRIVSMHSPAGGCEGRRVRRCALGTIAAGSSAEVAMRVSARRRGVLDYAASVVSDEPEAKVADNLADGRLRGR